MKFRAIVNTITFLLICLLCLPASLSAKDIKSIPNPAAAYCKQLGYTYEKRVAADGSEYGVCVFPDKSEANAWDFYKGKAGQKFSYCARKGYDVRPKKIIKNGYITECAECVSKLKDKNGVYEKVEVLELMKKNGDPLIIKKGKFQDKAKPDKVIMPNKNDAALLPGSTPLPDSFDWRDYNGHTYIGPVRDQGDCGSCYSFGAAAAAEGTYNVAAGLFDGSCIDFSEAFIAWCLSALPEYGSHFGGCDGADYEYAEIDALVNYGICEESDYPYTITPPDCCEHWNDVSIKFNQWHRVSCGNIDGIKAAIMNLGVVDAAVYVTNDFSNYSGGVFSDTQTSCPDCEDTETNHAIALVGWGVEEETGDEYWILRNSWGSSWGIESGYMRIATTSARVACAIAYLDYGTTASPTADFISVNCNSASAATLCLNDTLNFRDKSSGIPTSWFWDISPASGVSYINGTGSASQHPAVQFTLPGAYSVSLTVTNGSGSHTKTEADYVNVVHGQTVRLDLTTDLYGNETTWELLDSDNNVLYSGGPYASSTNFIHDICLNTGDYVFKIYDSWGDGICCKSGKGDYVLTNLTTGEVYIDSNGRFGSGETTAFSIPVSKGDVDGNGLVELNDAVLALQICIGMTPSVQIYIAADVNGDGLIGLDEAIYILEIISNIR